MTNMNSNLVKVLKVASYGLFLALAGSSQQSLFADTCNGTCGVLGADGVVTAAPLGSGQYDYVATSSSGPADVGVLQSVDNGLNEKTGSLLTTSVFSATNGSILNYYFNYVTTDGISADGQTLYMDYGWAGLFDASTNQMVSLLYLAETGVTPVNVVDPTLITGPMWTPLDGDSGTCFGPGCGYTGWQNVQYTITSGSGNYYIEAGAANWLDSAYQSGLAMTGEVIPPTGSNVPEPAALSILALGGFGLSLARLLRKSGA